MASRVVCVLVVGSAAALVSLTAVAGGIGGIDATVTGKAHDGRAGYVVATTDVGGFEFTRYVPTAEWSVIQEGDEVVYDVLSGETSVYTLERGDLIWRG
jgi:hypothetical protein